MSIKFFDNLKLYCSSKLLNDCQKYANNKIPANKQELVSVIMPNYNNEHYVCAALKSILEQSYENIEVIIIDDLSTDSSLEVIKPYLDDRVRVIENDKNYGVSSSRNIGIKCAKGNLITTLDSDDLYVNENKIMSEVALLNAMEGETTHSVIYSGVILILDELMRIKMPQNADKIMIGNIYSGLYNRSIFIPRDYLCRRDLLFSVGLYDENISLYEDWDLKLRLAKVAKYFYTSQIGIGYRRHGDGLSSANRSEHSYWINYIRDKNML